MPRKGKRIGARVSAPHELQRGAPEPAYFTARSGLSVLFGESEGSRKTAFGIKLACLVLGDESRAHPCCWNRAR